VHQSFNLGHTVVATSRLHVMQRLSGISMAVSHTFNIELVDNATGLFRSRGDGSKSANSCARTVGALRSMPKHYLLFAYKVDQKVNVLSRSRAIRHRDSRG
jgi:hypothetical protein